MVFVAVSLILDDFRGIEKPLYTAYSSKARAITNTGKGYPAKSDTLKRMILTYAKINRPTY